MKNSKVILGLGATVLAVGAVVAGRASVKYATPTKLFYTNGTTTCKAAATAITVSGTKLTTQGSGPHIVFNTGGVTNYPLYAATDGSASHLCIKPILKGAGF